MKIVIDSAIPFLTKLLEPFGEVCYVAGCDFTPALIRDADALIIRTRTRCDEALLKGSKVKLISTATIGYDHIDMEYCKRTGIEVTTAAGCNARGVLQWFAAALVELSQREGWSPSGRTIGVVGVGNVGRLIERYSLIWGFEVLRCDPPRARRGEAGFIELEELLSRSDIVTFHTPLNESSHHLLGHHNIGLLKPNCAIINTSRGECVDSEALLACPASHSLLLDVWEKEPNISRELLRRAVISTPHIAGYTLQGKANGSSLVVEALTNRFSLPLKGWYPAVKRNTGRVVSWENLKQEIGDYFAINQQSNYLKEHPEEFEELRNNYDYRVEHF